MDPHRSDRYLDPHCSDRICFLFQLVFGFEYAVLLTIIANTLVKYVLHSIDLHSENPWDNKAVFMLYTELAIGFVKVSLCGFAI